MNKKKIITNVLIILISLFIFIRNNRVRDFRIDIIDLVIEYNNNHYYGNKIHNINEIIPGYYQMVFSLKPLKYEYWISKKNIKKLTQKEVISI